MVTKAGIMTALAMCGACSGDEPCDPDAPGTICTIAGTGEIRAIGDNGPALEAGFNEPQDVIKAPDGTLWVTDFNFYTIRSIDPESGIVRRVAGITATLGDSPPPGTTQTPCLEASFNHTPTVHFLNGYAYLASWHNRRIKRIELSTMLVENYAGRGAAEQYDGDNGPALAAGVDLPSGVTSDPAGQIVWMDQANQVIRRVNSDGTIQRIGGSCVAGEHIQQCAPGQVPTACLNSNKFVCGSQGLCEDFCSPGFSGDGGPALDARLSQGAGQSTKPGGRLVYVGADLYFADRDNNRIRRIDAAGIITTIAGNGDEGYAGDGGPATAATLNHPIDLAPAPDGSLFFTDTANSCIRKIDPAGVISTVAGVCTPSESGTPPSGGDFSGDGGLAVDARLNWPYGIELDGNKLYIADSYNQRVRVVNL